MHARLPVPQFLAVALSTQAVRFLERDGLAAGQVKRIAIARIVTIQAPAMLLVVLQDDLFVHPGKNAARSVCGHALVARRAWENAFRKRRRRNFKPLVCPLLTLCSFNVLASEAREPSQRK
ncbi:MAG TPA: hypothetical protein VN442_00950 [Bryobacteraceae bacterium]|nr:hypothetical protein [Bryobacteraceae bacterium]